MKKFFVYTIGLYRRYISPLLPPACRFTPSCSEYAAEAFSRKGTLTAIWMTLVRIAKCHPFHPGGYDPVEKPGSESDTNGEMTSGCTTHTHPHQTTF